MLLLGIYLISFMVVWYVYLHKLPPHWCIQYGVYNVKYSILYTIQCILYGISYNFIMCSYDFIMCRIRDFALFLVKFCRIIQKYPPLWRKDFFQKTFMDSVYNTQKYLQWDFFRPTPIIQSHKFLLLYYKKFIHIKFLYKGQNINSRTKKVPLIH